MTEIYTDPAGLGYGGDLEIHQETVPEDRLIVRKADERVALDRKLWQHLVDVAYHEALLVDGGPEFEDSEDGKNLLLHIGTEGAGLGRVTYRVAEARHDWILVERVRDAA